MSTVTRDELMLVFQQLQGQFSSQKQNLADAQQRFDCGFHGHPATHSMNIRPLIPR